MRRSTRTNILLLAILPLILLVLACGPKSAKVTVKFVIFDNDNAFAATIYAQEVNTGQTFQFPYAPHTPYITVGLNTPGKYVFYARLVEAPDDYHYGYTSNQPGAYGHGTRGGTQLTENSLIAVEVSPQGANKAYISDHWAILPIPGKPVTVPWRME